MSTFLWILICIAVFVVGLALGGLIVNTFWWLARDLARELNDENLCL